MKSPVLKSHINTNTNKNGFFHPTKSLEGVLKYSYFVSTILNFQNNVFGFFCVGFSCVDREDAPKTSVSSLPNVKDR